MLFNCLFETEFFKTHYPFMNEYVNLLRIEDNPIVIYYTDRPGHFQPLHYVRILSIL